MSEVNAPRPAAVTPSSASTDTQSRRSSNKGGRRGYRGSDDGGRRGYRSSAPPRQVKFEDSCKELKGHIFDCSGYDQSDVFIKTQEQIAIYVVRTYTNGGAMMKSVETLEIPKVRMPPAPEGYGTDQVDASDRYVWELKMKEVIRNKQMIANQIQQIYALVLGQCTDSIVVRVDAHSNYEQSAEDRDGLALLRIIKSICFNFQDQKYVPKSIYEAK